MIKIQISARHQIEKDNIEGLYDIIKALLLLDNNIYHENVGAMLMDFYIEHSFSNFHGFSRHGIKQEDLVIKGILKKTDLVLAEYRIPYVEDSKSEGWLIRPVKDINVEDIVISISEQGYDFYRKYLDKRYNGKPWYDLTEKELLECINKRKEIN